MCRKLSFGFFFLLFSVCEWEEVSADAEEGNFSLERLVFLLRFPCGVTVCAVNSE